MRLVTSSYALDLSGVPTFTLTMYKELERRGHEVVVYSPLGGKLGAEMKTVKNIDELEAPDAIIAQYNTCAEDLKFRFPDVPITFYSHGLLPEAEQPPGFEADWYLAVNEEVEANLKDKGVPADKISIVRDFIDTERFKAASPINQKVERVLFISNYKKWKNFKTVNGACQKLNLALTCFGSPYGRSYKIEEAINDADLVISWGRGILEAMSCGRAALSFDRYEGDGYITPETYFEARKDNFSGRVFKYNYNPDTLAEEISKYRPEAGQVNREIIMKYHNVVDGVDQILALIKKL